MHQGVHMPCTMMFCCIAAATRPPKPCPPPSARGSADPHTHTCGASCRLHFLRYKRATCGGCRSAHIPLPQVDTPLAKQKTSSASDIIITSLGTAANVPPCKKVTVGQGEGPRLNPAFLAHGTPSAVCAGQPGGRPARRGHKPCPMCARRRIGRWTQPAASDGPSHSRHSLALNTSSQEPSSAPVRRAAPASRCPCSCGCCRRAARCRPRAIAALRRPWTDHTAAAKKRRGLLLRRRQGRAA